MIVFDIEGTVIILRSDMIKKGIDRAPHRSLLRAAGVKEEDMNKPFIAVCNSYIDIVPGHVHLREFSEYVKEAIREAGGVPFEFNTIGIDDGIAMGRKGRDDKLLATLLSAALEEMTAQQSSLLTN